MTGWAARARRRGGRVVASPLMRALDALVPSRHRPSLVCRVVVHYHTTLCYLLLYLTSQVDLLILDPGRSFIDILVFTKVFFYINDT